MPVDGRVSRVERERRNGHCGLALWLTGLSGAGKSTLAYSLERALHELGLAVFVLDGDALRQGLNRNLGFSREDRSENVRRAAETAKLFVAAGMIVAAAFISPYAADRAMARRLFAPGDFIEIYVKCPLEECARRDPKGLYARARNGEIPEFTGVNAPYEPPEQPEVVVETDRETVSAATERIVRLLIERYHLFRAGTEGFHETAVTQDDGRRR